MSANPITDLIGQLGFPIAISVWLLWERYKLNKERDEKLMKSLNDLHTAIIELRTYIKAKLEGDNGGS